MKVRRRVTINGGDVFPSIIVVDSGSNIQLKIVNNDSEPHVIWIKNTLNDVEIPAFETKTVRVSAPPQGVYTLKLDGRNVATFVVI